MSDDPKDELGGELWDILAPLEDAPLPEGFDERFQKKLRRSHLQLVSMRRVFAVGTLLALAASLLLMVRPAPPSSPNDLALVAELDIVENLDMLQDFDVLLAWDGSTP